MLLQTGWRPCHFEDDGYTLLITTSWLAECDWNVKTTLQIVMQSFKKN